MQDFILSRREEIAELCRNYHVSRLSIFGSAARDDFDNATSDIDVIVDFDLSAIPDEEYSRNKRAFQETLSLRLRRKVDLLTWESVKNPYLLKEIHRSHETLYAA